MTYRLEIICVILACQLLGGSDALAERHLLTIAAHRGSSAETPLRYAGRDASRVQKVMLQMGGVQPAHTVSLVDPSAADVRRALSALAGGRVKAGDALVTYVSSHMDSHAIHLGPERLPFAEIVALARRTGASMRLFILDGCQSGAITTKGVRRTGPVRVILPRARPATGELFLTSTSPGEDALESTRLAGSFFTHYLVTGLRGAADGDGDGRVSVDEVFRFARDHTIYATAGAPTGPQHPSFKLDLAGSKSFTLTEIRAGRQHGALFSVDTARDGVAYLLNGITNHLEAEVPLRQRGSVIVPPGPYRVRVATSREVKEATLTLHKGDTIKLSALRLRAVPLLALVRKGEGQRRSRLLLSASFEGGVPASEGFGPLFGGRISAALAWRSISLSMGLSYGYASVQNDFIDLRLHHIGLSLGVTHPISVGPLIVSFGLAFEGLVLAQELIARRRGVDTDGGRASFVLGLTPLVCLEFPVESRWVPALSLRGRVLFGADGAVRFAPVGTVGLGWVF